ncbi:hypothetical protein AK812_SmicGene4417 [Symbiodinium microadriaticum]|uniref:Uncharacterized protein n=1 Tax=Symbiodinium microadriaticum TaxID=2951 RepID=A0A1Q9EWF6_SYMMI|nr:hypothetical protein AK812_SmicGene4417 [Symbiodinium microadriaticum]
MEGIFHQEFGVLATAVLGAVRKYGLCFDRSVEPPPAPAQLSRGQASSSSRECEETPAAASASPPTPACGDGSDASASTRASSEEPPDEEKAQLAAGAKRLMEEMGWTPQDPEARLLG